MLSTTCPDCASETHFCATHQAHEKEVYNSTIFKGRHETQEFRMVLHDARQQDMEA